MEHILSEDLPWAGHWVRGIHHRHHHHRGLCLLSTDRVPGAAKLPKASVHLHLHRVMATSSLIVLLLGDNRFRFFLPILFLFMTR